MAATDLVLAFTGASGTPYGVRLLEILLNAGRTVHLTISPAAVEVMQRELDRTIALEQFEPRTLVGSPLELSQLHYHHYRDFQSGIASGSFLHRRHGDLPVQHGYYCRYRARSFGESHSSRCRRSPEGTAKAHCGSTRNATGTDSVAEFGDDRRGGGNRLAGDARVLYQATQYRRHDRLRRGQNLRSTRCRTSTPEKVGTSEPSE